MGFISYNLNYYKQKIEYYENNVLKENNKIEIKRLQKFLDDLKLEGYFNLCNKMEEQFSGISRLKSIFQKNNIKPFNLPDVEFDKNNLIYDETVELSSFIDKLVSDSRKSKKLSNNHIIEDLLSFTKWIGYNDNISYIFLLRDVFLPYLFYLDRGRNNIYPWIVGRRYLEWISGKKNIDDDFRNYIFDALENNCSNFEDFKEYVIPKIQLELDNYKNIKFKLKNMLNNINKEKILVVESGVHGTIPLILMSIDSRVDFRMFTTVPYLNRIYSGRIFTDEFEKNMNFEFLYSQNMLMKFHSIKNQNFFVSKCTNKDVINESMSEIKRFLKY